MLKSTINIEANAKEFEESYDKFTAYKTALEQTPEVLAKYTQEIHRVEQSAQNVTKFYEELSSSTRQASTSMQRFGDAATRTRIAFHKLGIETAHIAKSLSSVSDTLFKLIPALGIGLITGALGSGFGIHVLDSVAADVLSKRRTALGLGMTYGAVQSFGVNYSRYGLGADTLEATAGGLYDATSPAYRSLVASGINPRGQEAGGATLAEVQRMREVLAPFAGKDNLIPMAEAYGYDETFSHAQIRSLVNAKPNELAEQYKHYQEDTKAFEIPPDAAEKWANFRIQVTLAGEEMESIIAKQLGPLAPPLTHLAESAGKFIDVLIKSGLAKDGIGHLHDGLKWLSDEIGSGEAKEKLKSFFEAIHGLTQKFLPLVDWIQATIGLAKASGDFLNWLNGKATGAGQTIHDAIVSPIRGIHTGAPDVQKSAPLPGTEYPSIRHHTWKGPGTIPSEDKPGESLKHPKTLIEPPTSPMSLPSPPQSTGRGWNTTTGEIPPDILTQVQAANPGLTPRQCVELVQSTMGVGNVHDWRRGPGEMDTPVGAALATFGEHGDSETYAYGGSGTPGINRDHALILIKKYSDGSFDAISQDSGHAPHMIHMPWTGQGGEGDASSYFAIYNRHHRPAGRNASIFTAAKPSQPSVPEAKPSQPTIPVISGGDDLSRPPKLPNDTINPTFYPAWNKGLYREGIFTPLPAHPRTPTPIELKDRASGTETPKKIPAYQLDVPPSYFREYYFGPDEMTKERYGTSKKPKSKDQTQSMNQSKSMISQLRGNKTPNAIVVQNETGGQASVSTQRVPIAG